MKGNCVFNFTNDPVGDIVAYACGYRRAAEVTLEQVMSRASYRDNDCYPVFFLYRHSLELCCKAVVLKGAKLVELLTDREIDTTKVLRSHRLICLLPAIKAIFLDRGWTQRAGESNMSPVDEIALTVE